MRILFLNHNVVGVGTYQRAWRFGRELAKRGHDVTLVTTSRTARVRARWEEREGVRVLEAPDLWAGPARSGWDPWNTLRRLGLLAGQSFELVHAFDARPVVIFPALAMRRATGAALFMDWADWWGRGGTIQERSGWLVRTAFGPVETWFEETFRGRAHASTVISEALRRRCIELGVTWDRVLRIPDGCVPPEDAEDAERDEAVARRRARSELRLDAEAPLVVHLGTALPGDAAMLFDAMRGVSRSVPGARLAMVGGYHGRVPADLHASGAVVRTGFLPRVELSRWLSAASVCVIPLRDTIANRGRWPGKISEYLAAGRAIVMTSVGDAAERVEQAGAGWVCEPDAQSMAAALLEAVRHPDETAAAERGARILARTGLAWPRLAAVLDDYYGAVINGGEPTVNGQSLIAGRQA